MMKFDPVWVVLMSGETEITPRKKATRDHLLRVGFDLNATQASGVATKVAIFDAKKMGRLLFWSDIVALHPGDTLRGFKLTLGD